MTEHATPDLGDRVKDRISGLTGIVTALSIHLSGNQQATVEPEGPNQQGEIRQPRWIDLYRLEVTEPGAIERPERATGLYL